MASEKVLMVLMIVEEMLSLVENFLLLVECLLPLVGTRLLTLVEDLPPGLLRIPKKRA